MKRHELDQLKDYVQVVLLMNNIKDTHVEVYHSPHKDAVDICLLKKIELNRLEIITDNHVNHIIDEIHKTFK